MSVRVNLLPGEAAQRNAAARQRALIGAAGVGVVALLGAAYLFQANRVSSAESELAQEQLRIDELTAEIAELQEFADLQTARLAADDLFRARFGGEVSFAGILQDVATVYPSSAELESLNVALTDRTADLGALRVAIGRLTASGATLRGHAPGLERLLLELEKVAGFSNVFFSNSTQRVDVEGVAAFTLDVDLSEDILTDRYLDGLPEELR